jgi:hypothetical protein
MNEMDLCMTLGILPEPVKNRVSVDPEIHSQIIYLKEIFTTLQAQREHIGIFNPDLWCELLPWHSMN